MNSWKISEAKARIAVLLQSCETEPQIICNRDKPVGAVINMDLFEELMEYRKQKETPTVMQLLRELDTIKEAEQSELKIPSRTNRPTPFEESANEMALGYKHFE